MAMCLCGMPAEFECQLHPDGSSQECRRPDRVPLYGYVSMEKTRGQLYCLVLLRDVHHFETAGFIRSE